VPTRDEAYLRNRNNVSLLTTRRLVYIKKRLVGQYWELVDVPRDHIAKVELGKKLALGGLVAGIGAVLLALLVLYSGLVTKQMSGLGVATIPPILGIPGIILVLGAIRKTVDFTTESGVYRFVARPLKGKVAEESFQKASRALGQSA